MDDSLGEAIQYFKQEPAYHRLLIKFIERYKRLGRIGGSVEINSLTDKEKELLEAVLQRNFSHKAVVKIQLSKFEEGLSLNTRFEGVGLKDLLDGYAGKKILTNKEEQELFEKEKKQYFTGFQLRCQNNYSHIFLQNIIDKEGGTRGIHQLYKSDPLLLTKHMTQVIDGLNKLPLEEYTRLPVFAAAVTGNPHSFDIQKSDTGKIFLLALEAINGKKAEQKLNSEEISELLGGFRIIRDDLLNFTTCVGLLAFNDCGQVIPMWKEAVNNKITLNVPLRELIKIETVKPAPSSKVVFVLENSGVFSALLDYFETELKYPPMVCTHGQGKWATKLMIEKILKSGSIIFYNGDYDPEGLLMADKLAKRYKGKVTLWRYSEEDYQNAASNVKVDSQRRIKQLQSIETDELIPVKELLAKQMLVGYQENILELLVKDIEKELNN